MSNRRRPHGTRDQRIAAYATCPDCASDVQLGDRDPDSGLWHARVFHDATCPRLAVIRRDDLIHVVKLPADLLDEDVTT